MISESLMTVGPLLEYPVKRTPLIWEFSMVTQGVEGSVVPLEAVTVIPLGRILSSMTVPQVVMVLGPVYAVRVVPVGTPVLAALGNAPELTGVVVVVVGCTVVVVG